MKATTPSLSQQDTHSTGTFSTILTHTCTPATQSSKSKFEVTSLRCASEVGSRLSPAPEMSCSVFSVSSMLSSPCAHALVHFTSKFLQKRATRTNGLLGIITLSVLLLG
ncbi:hypothetical protein E2C01_006654 [Portunus trituberculatus]|uniref:Uncharacterized protein n=1 Tax=Portunus trituberculatus TaxID=210409 RepID=A0A5B7D092_PORTR|nr:hypothetical protein [Portunus trituberculatus]